jgi:ribosome-associated translation inhibitor RaiA
MVILIEGVSHDAALRALIVRKLEALGARLRPSPVSARAAFTDENGPKGGVDTRCALTLEVPRRPAMHAEEVATTHRLAFDATFVSLERQIRRDREASRAQRRRPKKFYLAKRLREGGASPEAGP